MEKDYISNYGNDNGSFISWTSDCTSNENGSDSLCTTKPQYQYILDAVDAVKQLLFAEQLSRSDPLSY